MSAHASPNIITDSLAFMYDTGDGKSYKGEPTVNLATDSPSQGGWAGGREVLDSSRKKFRFIVNNFNGSAGSGQGWRSFTWDLNSYSGQSVTISATVEVPSASPGTFAWIMMGQTNTHTSNNSGAGQYMGYSAASERVSKTTTTTEHITWTGTVGSTGTASQPSGHVGFTLWYNGGTIGVDSYVEVSNVQIEINSHATQFVNGTRSATQGLIDRTGTSTINISNASFDSNAQMTFDGTDDYAEVADQNSLDLTTAMSFEFVVKPDSSQSNPYPRLIDKSVYLLHLSQTSPFGIFQNIYTSGGLRQTGISSVVTAGNWNHIVCTYDGQYGKVYVNAELVKTRDFGSVLACNTNSSSLKIAGDGTTNRPLNGEMPISKIYNKVLTAAEVAQNYNAFKDRFGL